jgi:tRNA(Ile)-lysidine synthase
VLLLRYNNFVNINDLQYILQHNCQIGINKAVVTGVSGGPDSLCLLDILCRLGYPIIVAHLNHGLRSKSDQEAHQVHQHALSRNLPYVQKKVDIYSYAQENRLSIEEAARVVRYRFLFDLARKNRAQAVAVGHTADDQVETVLMHYLRGSGLAGLSGMGYYSLPNSWDKEIPIVRPLLGTWRDEIIQYLQERGIQPEIDESNQDRRYFRNRLRHDLIPELEHYNPKIKKALFHTAEILRGDHAIIQQSVDRVWAECCIEHGAGYIGFALDGLSRQPVGMQRQLLRRGMTALIPDLRDIEFKVIERGVERIKHYGFGKTELISGLHIQVDPGVVWLVSQNATLPIGDWPQVISGKEYYLDLPGECKLGNGWKIRAEQLLANAELFARVEKNTDPYRVWMDADKIVFPLLVRKRLAGDRFKPFGMGGHSVKLSDLMINFKVPSKARISWPVLVSGEEITWVPGVRMGEIARLVSSTQRVAFLQLQKTDDVRI